MADLTPTDNADGHSEYTLDLYKVAVDSADKVSARRGSANHYFLSLEVLILGVPAVFKTEGVDPIYALSLSAVGAIVGVVWWLQLRSYRQLNGAKYRVITDMEGRFFQSKPFSDEWLELKGDRIKRWRGRYAELGASERVVPWLFVGLNLGLGVRQLWSL